VDEEDRLLLVRFRFPNGDVWATPGGGVDGDETLAETVRRELHEEVGYVDAEIGPAIWTRVHQFPFVDGYDGQTETVFLVRVEAGEQIDPALTADELLAENLAGSAWWTLPQLLASDERFAPRRLPTLVADLFTHGPPPTPLDVGI
jgi:8-oxo-dGTP pyrophosphatase MutT (NUDIX family)